MSSVIVIDQPLEFDFTEENLAACGQDLVVPGDYLSYRFQARRADAAVSLALAVIVLSVRKKESTDAADLLFQRRSADTIGGGWTPPTKQIALDADQVNEDTLNDTGKGWYAINFAPTDEATLLASVGLWVYDVKVKFSDGVIRTLLRGRFQVLRPRTIGSQFL